METPKANNLNELHSRRHTLRTKHIRYQKTSKDLLAKLSDPKNTDAAEVVKDTYSLLRLFSLTYNQIHLSREDNKATLPAAFETELKKVLTEANYTKFDETFKVRGQDFAASLPASLDKSVVEGIVKFVQHNEAEHINARYEKDLAELTTQIDGRKGETATKERPAPKKRNENHEEDSLEDQMTNLLKKINNKARFIKLQKDDFEAYSNAQAQFDLLFDDVAMEIMKMKKNLRVKFNKVQKGD
tara:strand:+ start:137 stop:865 length:729 start_codon:yes stop_codon:yes gene_type:complete